MPSSRLCVVIVGATASVSMVMLNCFESDDTEFVALTVKLNVSADVGVPEIAPVVLFKLNPVGRLPLAIDHVIGVVPVAVSVWL